MTGAKRCLKSVPRYKPMETPMTETILPLI
jgi:hypothetical protein